MAATAQQRSFFDVFVGEPLTLAKDQPHQVLLSTGSVAIMAQFAAHGGIVDPLVGYCIAVGVEWAYLRGLASDSRVRTRWGDALNWSAFGIVVLWGILWVATVYGAIPAKLEGFAALLVAAAHVVPIAWLALCSAQCHRAMVAAEYIERTKAANETAEREKAAADERRAFELEQEQKDRELARWKEAYTLKQQMKADAPALSKMRRDAQPESINADEQICPKCGAHIESRSAWLAARRWQRCAACKEEAA